MNYRVGDIFVDKYMRPCFELFELFDDDRDKFKILSKGYENNGRTGIYIYQNLISAGYTLDRGIKLRKLIDEL
jgi:hypothetical protein